MLTMLIVLAYEAGRFTFLASPEGPGKQLIVTIFPFILAVITFAIGYQAARQKYEVKLPRR